MQKLIVWLSYCPPLYLTDHNILPRLLLPNQRNDTASAKMDTIEIEPGGDVVLVCGEGDKQYIHVTPVECEHLGAY